MEGFGVAYVRVSTDKQDSESQKSSIKRWELENDCKVGCWLEDVGSRDQAYKRADFQRLMGMVEDGKVDWIVVDALDRLGVRGVYELGRIVCTLQENDVQLVSISEGVLTDEDMTTEIFATIASARSRDEQVQRSSRSIRGKIDAVKRGEFQGGNPPFGFDVLCVDAQGKEKWRVVYEGHYQRVKITPDGMRVQYDGKDNFPVREHGETLRLVPSIITQRIETVRNIFKWYATEAISLRGICTRLNEMGIDPVFGKGWYSSKLRPLLENPVYVDGVASWNKVGHGRFLEFVDGGLQKVERSKGRVKAGRVRDSSDHITSDTPGEGLISQETWDLVQAKLKGIITPPKAPKNPQLWLAGFLYCAHCGKPMHAWHSKKEKACSYTCGSYRLMGKSNPYGCRLHRTQQKVIERLIDRYLAETESSLDLSLNPKTDEDSLVQMLEEDSDSRRMEFLQGVVSLWKAVRGAGATPPSGKPWTVTTLKEAYTEASSGASESQRAELQAKEAEFNTLVEQFKHLKSQRAIDRANEEMLKLEEVINALEGSLKPVEDLGERVECLRDELVGLQERINSARETLEKARPRQKAQALSKVISRIELHYEHRQAGSQDRSILDRVVIIPVLGDQKEYGGLSSGNMDRDFRRESLPERDSITKVLTRTFDSVEIDTVKRELGMVKDLANSACSMLPQILELREQGISKAEIGRRLGVSRKSVERAIRNHG